MIELPETHVLSEQITQTLVGKVVKHAAANTHPHSFAWYTGDPALYNSKLVGKKITGSAAYGGRPEIWAEDMRISFCDGVNTRYLNADEKRPLKHQLLVEFEDGTAISCSIQMYGGIFVFPEGSQDDSYLNIAMEKPSPYSEDFDEIYFDGLLSDVKPNLSVKAFLATKQRIPGLGNGVLQDILFNARVHPKRKLQTLDDEDMQNLFTGIKSTLKDMWTRGGRDTEKDLFNRKGGYLTILSKNTIKHPCRVCGWDLVREAYLGGNIYFCPVCQPL
jgi:formamidopyrimidine-DNA glycosylase